MKAYVDGGEDGRDREYRNLKEGYPIQEKKAKELHSLAGVSEGPCGIPELKTFQEAHLLYQLKVLSVTPPYMLIYEGSTPSDKIIRILKDGARRM